MTVADVVPVKGGAVLTQDGQELTLSILAPSDTEVAVVSLDPPPLKIDKTIPNLKRIEIRVLAQGAKAGSGTIRVRLSGNEPTLPK